MTSPRLSTAIYNLARQSGHNPAYIPALSKALQSNLLNGTWQPVEEEPHSPVDLAQRTEFAVAGYTWKNYRLYDQKWQAFCKVTGKQCERLLGKPLIVRYRFLEAQCRKYKLTEEYGG